MKILRVTVNWFFYMVVTPILAPIALPLITLNDLRRDMVEIRRARNKEDAIRWSLHAKELVYGRKFWWQ